MKKYNVYAIGNALVDYEIKASEQMLLDHQVEKGLMTLVEEARQAELTAAASGHVVKKQGGGSAANSIVAFSQLGGRGFYSCKVAHDEDGKFYLADLHENGVGTNLTYDRLAEGTTGKCLILITPDAERTMNTYLGITSDFSVAELDKEALINSEYLFMEGYLVASPSGRQAMITAKKWAEENNVRVSLSFSDPSMVKYFQKEMDEVVGEKIDLLFCNEEEALLFTQAGDLQEATEQLKKRASQFVITRGKSGAVIWDGETFVDIKPYPVEAIDTTGAGDMFSGAFLYGITQGYSLASAGKIASMASSRVVTQYGPRLATNELQEIANRAFAD
ncbi:MAG: adenosine kinase [Cyclobacteriaceae bacterium]|nr:adenosine kinase [Cyclobacteriaceae bacterium]